MEQIVSTKVEFIGDDVELSATVSFGNRQVAKSNTQRLLFSNIYSRVFKANINEAPLWSITLLEKSKNRYCSTYFKLLKSKSIQLVFSLTFLVLDSNGVEFFSKSTTPQKIEKKQYFLISNCIPKSCLNAQNACKFKIVVVLHSANNCDTNICHFKYLLNDPTFSDIVLNARGEKFYVHKAILAIRSTTFAEMLKVDTKEHYMDIEPLVLKEMLHYIYTGTVPGLNEVDLDLLELADRYDLQALKEMCEESLIDKLCIETIIETLKAADAYSSRLKSAVIEFLNEHGEDIIYDPVWKILKELHSDVIFKAYEKIAAPVAYLKANRIEIVM